METNERLIYLRKILLNKTRSDFARAVNISVETLRDIEDKTIKQFSAKNANIISSVIVQDAKGNVRILDKKNPIRAGEYYLNPAWLAYGIGDMFVKPFFSFTSESDGFNVELKKHDFIRFFTLNDDAMTPKYYKGMYFAVDTSQKEVKNGVEYYVKYKEKQYLRQINILGLDKIQLHAYNMPEKNSFKVSKNEIEIIGELSYLVIIP